MRSSLLVVFALAVSEMLLSTGARAQSDDRAAVAFTIADSTLVPEGIAHDPVTGAFFVSSTYRRKVVRVAADGTASDFVASGSSGLLGAVGMRVDPERRVLWVASSHGGDGMPMVDPDEFPEGSAALHAFDIESGALLQRFARPPGADASFLNDVAIDSTGAAYVTDTRGARIFRALLDADSLEVFADLSDIGRPNGIAFDRRGMLFASVPDGIARIDPRTGAASLLPMEEGIAWAWADGIVWHDDGIIGIQGFEGAPVRWYGLDPDGTRVVAEKTLLESHPALEQPTTGVLVDEALYLIANSHLQTFRRAQEGEAAGPLREATVLRILLSPR